MHFASSDGQAVLPANSALANGTGSFPATLKTITAATTITVSDATTSSISGGSTPIGIVSIAATHFAIATPGLATTRMPFNFAISAQDVINNVSASYSWAFKFTSTDSQANLPANSPIANGTGSFSAALETAGSQTISAAETVAASLKKTSSTIAVTASATLAISSAAPPSGRFGVIYGPGVIESLE